ncbi:ABC transporter ATP-binding protein [Treponema primitia]|uniref:oligopeptide/dipeptide ABC transporter ATP-binding protein n=1 Tax=Treponema primitia TaxID=88058 RepID=UPI00030CBB44|nr:ABC transporter ATP-binding protein [Treponema primitia]
MEQNTKPAETILSVRDFSIRFLRYEGTFKRQALEVISALEVEIKAGEIAAIVGASGSGKSLLAHAILGILPPNAAVSGEMSYCGEALTQKKLETLRGNKIVLVPQSVSFLDPLMKVGNQVMGENHSAAEVEAVFKRYNLAPRVMELYPFELSGGMARRVLVAAAVITGANLIIADEPTPGLSEALAREALSHLRELADSGTAVMLITHDIRMALQVSDKIAIFYAGMTVETALRDDFSGSGTGLRHPYTRALWRALPQNDFTSLPGTQPYAGTLKDICPFFSRCKIRTEECRNSIPLQELRGGKVRCIHAA